MAGLIPPGSGGGAVSVGRTAFVDGVLGNDGSAIAGRMDKPFATIQAAYVAARTLAGSGFDSYVDIGFGTFTENLTLDGSAAGGGQVHFVGKSMVGTQLNGEIAASNSAFFWIDTMTVSGKITLNDSSAVFLDRDVSLGGVANNIVMPNTATVVIAGNGVYFGGANCFSVSGGAITVQLLGKARTDGTLGANVTLDRPKLFARPDNFQTGTSYTVTPNDSGLNLHFNNAGAITVTVPASLGADFECNCLQNGAGQVTFVASGTTLNSYGSLLKIAGQHGTASLKATAANVLNLSGALSA